MNTGVLGGTFDPVHNGHLAVAEAVRSRLHLDRVIFVPAGRPWLKKPVSSAVHRAGMVEIAITGRSYFELSTMELERPGPTYAVDTMAELKLRSGMTDSLFFILGWDSLLELPGWHEPERLITLCSLVAVPRPGCRRPDLKLLDLAVPGISDRVVLLDEPEIDISATDIRSRVAHGLSIGDLVPGPVAGYIRQRGLYLAEPDKGSEI